MKGFFAILGIIGLLCYGFGANPRIMFEPVEELSVERVYSTGDGEEENVTFVSCLPDIERVRPGDIVTAEIYVSNVSNMSGYEVKVESLLPVESCYVDVFREDFAFYGFNVLSEPCDAVNGRFFVVGWPATVDTDWAYLGEVSFVIPDDALPGEIFTMQVSETNSWLIDPPSNYLPFVVGPPCEVQVSLPNSQVPANSKQKLFHSLSELGISSKTNLREYYDRFSLPPQFEMEFTQTEEISIGWNSEGGEFILFVREIKENRSGLLAKVNLIFVQNHQVWPYDFSMQIKQEGNDIVIVPEASEVLLTLLPFELPKIVVNSPLFSIGLPTGDDGELNNLSLAAAGQYQIMPDDSNEMQVALRVCECFGGPGSCSTRMCDDGTTCENPNQGDCMWTSQPEGTGCTASPIYVTLIGMTMTLWMSYRRRV